MIGAVCTTLFFACNAIFANRSAQRLGSNEANLARLIVGAVVLGLWAHVFGGALRGASVGWFFLSGIAGFGIGGVAMFQALPRIGSPLAMLIVQCGSSLVALLLEWTWLHTQVSAPQLALIAVTLAGVVLGLLPRSFPRVSVAVFHRGVAWAALSACGQGVGAVLSRRAFQIAAAVHEHPDAPTTAYQRALGGLCVATIAVLISLWRQRAAAAPTPRAGGRAWPWVLANSITGPVLGVTSFQWALSTTPASIVQPIVATAPLVTIPLAMWLENARPRALYYVGAALAVLGVAGLFGLR